MESFLTGAGNSLEFAGLLTSSSGETAGTLRFSGSDGALTVKLLDGSETEIGSGSGTFDSTARTLEFSLASADGEELGAVSGLYAEPSYSSRGSFSGHLLCP